MPKYEIYDRSDFHDFYTIKSLQEGDFGVKYVFLIRGLEISCAYAQSIFKERSSF
jgi:hypothetical protein